VLVSRFDFAVGTGGRPCDIQQRGNAGGETGGHEHSDCNDERLRYCRTRYHSPSLARPGGSITGVIQDDTAEISGKRMQFLKDAVPHITKVAVLLNPDQPYDQSQWRQLEITARSLKITLQQLAARRASEFVGAFAAINSDRPDALLIGREKQQQRTAAAQRLLSQVN
jgi:ABC-type uncharacterized transport system substrate-binding protein